jgi:hypothetical protein
MFSRIDKIASTPSLCPSELLQRKHDFYGKGVKARAPLRALLFNCEAS